MFDFFYVYKKSLIIKKKLILFSPFKDTDLLKSKTIDSDLNWRKSLGINVKLNYFVCFLVLLYLLQNVF